MIRHQFARFASQCRPFAPLYWQVTLAALRSALARKPMAADRDLAYGDVTAAWKHYLDNDNHGCGVVLIGHSQGSSVLARLIRDQIDGKPVQERIVSALLVGTNVAVPKGKDVGGAFQSMPLCRKPSQTGCVVTYASFRSSAGPPPSSLFGRVPGENMRAGCTNPAALSGGSGELKAYFASSGRTGTSSAEPRPWVTPPQTINTPFVTVPGLLTAECVSNENGSYLEVTVHGDPADPRTDDIAGDVIVDGAAQLGPAPDRRELGDRESRRDCPGTRQGLRDWNCPMTRRISRRTAAERSRKRSEARTSAADLPPVGGCERNGCVSEHHRNVGRRMRCSFPSAAMLAVVLAGCSRQKDGPKQGAAQPPAAPVTVAAASRRTIPVQVRAIGNVEPFSTINVKAEVGGQLQRAFFTEGDMVKKGQLLFQIDPRPQQETIRQLEANLAKDAATARNAQAEASRYGELFKQGIVARAQFEQYETTAASWQATLDADRAEIENARLQLQYASIHSPITGRTGNLLVKEGNLVKANDVPLVTINQIEPIYVSFAVPEKELPEIQARFASGLHVQAMRSGDPAAAYGKLSFIDNAVDATTGTIRMKATFPNSDRRLWPGQFVDVVVTVSQQSNAVVVPSQAVQAGQKGLYVYVVDGHGKAEYRTVTVGRAAGDEIAVGGVNPGERVVTDGQSKLTPGARVQVVDGNGAPAKSQANAGGPGP